MSQPAPKSKADVPTQIFEQFCDELPANGVPLEVATRIRKTLVEEGKFSETAIKAAMFGLDQPQP